MKILLLLLFVFFNVISVVAQRQTLDVSGKWASSLGDCVLPGTTDENKLGDGKHPTDVTIQLTRLYPYEGVVSYEKDIELPKSMEGQQLLLCLERTKKTEVFVDGVSIGTQKGIYGQQVYSLGVLKNGTHHLRIDVDNRAESFPQGIQGSHAWTDGTQTNWNGIVGKMEIVALPANRIEEVQLYPDIDLNEVKVKVNVYAEKKGKYEMKLRRSVYDNEDPELAMVSHKGSLSQGNNEIELTLDMGENPHLWSEFHPDLYSLTVSLSSKGSVDEVQRQFGMRKFGVDGTQFVVNGNKTFLRGTHDGCVFPLTGYCPADVDEWRKMFRIAKEYGINHYRFHSYTPTEAAFQAADEEGIYLHTELPMWGTIDSTTVELNAYLKTLALDVLKNFGNHPSFFGLGLGNELWGDNEMMKAWLDEFREMDPSHLYSQGSNNDLGWKGAKVDGEDFYITCRVGGAPMKWEDFTPEMLTDKTKAWIKEVNEAGFGTHARTSFSFADADNGGILNTLRPNTLRDFSNVVPLSKVPIVSHETCQFQIYPDYKEIPKYTGVLYPFNHEIFRDRLKENGLTPQIDAFHNATGLWAVDCYKADMEYCMRTQGFGGYQLLDIKDYPGQGSALCGILDAFMGSKGIVKAEDFRGWNSPVVPMAVMDSYCWQNTDTLKFDIRLSNYTEDDYRQPVAWTLAASDGTFCRKGEIADVDIWNGEVVTVGSVSVPLAEIKAPVQLKLTLQTGDYHNYYTMWVYAEEKEYQHNCYMADTIDSKMLKVLEKGGTVLLCPKQSSIEKQSVGGLFTPDYWNYAMFKTISENNSKPVSPGTLGMLMDAEHPLFGNFPTEGRTNWQWWSIALNSRPLILNSLPKDYLPIIQTVDNIERNHKLGILMEFKYGKGKLVICTTDLKEISKYVEGKAYRNAVLKYVDSSQCNPQTQITEQEMKDLLYSETQVRDIQGVKNISDYKEM